MVTQVHRSRAWKDLLAEHEPRHSDHQRLGAFDRVPSPSSSLEARLTVVAGCVAQYGAEVKGNARSAVTMKYPEFEQDSDDEEEDEEDDDEEDEDDENIKLPKIITKEPVLAVLRPNAVRSLLSAVTYATLADRVLSHALQIEQASINVTLVEDVEVVEFSVTGEKCVRGPRTLAG